MRVTYVPPEAEAEKLSRKEACEFLTISKSTLDRHVKQNPWLKKKVGRRSIFRREDLRRLRDGE